MPDGLDSVTWQRLEAILDELFELPPEQVDAAVDRLCGNEGALRRRVVELLDADRQTDGPLDGEVEGYLESLVRSGPGSTPSEAEDLSGRHFGPYEILRRIGSGGMGVVYEAYDERLGRSVALKLLPRELSRDDNTKSRFLREARAASALDHGNICTVHDLGESDDGRLFIVMAYYEGETLKSILERGPLPPQKARRLARQIASGLHSAHLAGVIHRDIKPANVVVTEQGEAKILDFGIAKMRGEAALTRTGAAPGTPAYMSPEQVRGDTVDQRSDVWALGVLLYEMLTGVRPFRSDSVQGVIYNILHRQPQALGEQVPEVAPDLVAVVERALAKDADQRYATCAELELDLDGTVSGISGMQSSWVQAKERATPSKHSRSIAAGLVAVVALVGWVWFAARSSDVNREPELGVGTRVADAATNDGEREVRMHHRVAVLPFANLNSVDDLDWLRQGVAQMLVTDLAQSPEIEVLSGRRLRQALDEVAEDAEQSDLSFEQLQALGRATEVEAVVQGSFVQLGETLRVTFALEKVADGDILRSETVEGRGSEALFDLVDRITQHIRSEYEIVARPAEVRDIQQVTTSSVEAWRVYTESVQMSSAGKRNEAMALLEKAVELDPNFAMALSNLGGFLNLQGRSQEAQLYNERAVALADKLPLHERYPIEAVYHLSRWSTYPQAIEAYETGLEIYPHRHAWRANLARIYAYLERYDDALDGFLQVIEEGSTHTGNTTEAANVLAALDRFDEGQALLEKYARAYPDRWSIHLGLGWHATEWGRYGEAHRHFERAGELRPGEFYVAYGLWRAAVLEGDWPQAERWADEMASHDTELADWLSAVARSRNALHQGQVEAGLVALNEATQRPQPDSFSAQARVWLATTHLDQGDAQAAFDAAEKAQQEGRGDWPELEGLFVAAQAAESLGDRAGADERLAVLEGHNASHPNRVEQRQIHRLKGWLALQRGDLDAARRELNEALALLPPRGVEFVWFTYPDHVPIRYALGLLEEAAGQPAAAEEWFERCRQTGSERLERPVAYRRCFGN